MAAAPASSSGALAAAAPECTYHCPFPFTGEFVENAGMRYRCMSKDDHLTFRRLADELEGFKLRYEKEGCYVWDKKIPGESIHMVKMFGTLENVTPAMLYDVLHDPNYRGIWDEAKLEGFRICLLNERNEIGYYAAKIPGPVSNRSFLNQRSWLAAGNGEYVIFNSSVPHANLPVEKEKDYVRAISKVSGYLVRPWGAGGCSITYITLSDPGGWIPTTAINYLTTKLAPNTLTNLRKACGGYNDWIAKQANYTAPWRTSSEADPWTSPQQNQVHDFVIARQGLAGGAPPPSPGPIGVTPCTNDAKAPDASPKA